MSEVREHLGQYTITDHGDTFWLEVRYNGCDCFIDVPNPHTSVASVNKAIAECERKLAIIAAINEHTTEMEGYCYYGSNPGVPVDSYDDIAKQILDLIDKGIV